MIRAHRRTHRFLLSLLALLLPLLALLGLAARKAAPTMDKLPLPPAKETTP